MKKMVQDLHFCLHIMETAFNRNIHAEERWTFRGIDDTVLIISFSGFYVVYDTMNLRDVSGYLDFATLAEMDSKVCIKLEGPKNNYQLYLEPLGLDIPYWVRVELKNNDYTNHIEVIS